MTRRRATIALGPPIELLDTEWLWSRLPRVQRFGGPGVDRHRGMVRELVSRSKLQDNSEWNDYGSGVASFSDIWVFRDEPAFRRPKHDGADYAYTGLWVLLCRLAPCCVMGQGEKSWSATNGGRYMPSFNGVDRFTTPEVEHLAHRVAARLDAHGLTRLRTADVAPLLPTEWQFQSNLADGPLRIFDALFHWND